MFMYMCLSRQTLAYLSLSSLSFPFQELTSQINCLCDHWEPYVVSWYIKIDSSSSCMGLRAGFPCRTLMRCFLVIIPMILWWFSPLVHSVLAVSFFYVIVLFQLKWGTQLRLKSTTPRWPVLNLLSWPNCVRTRVPLVLIYSPWQSLSLINPHLRVS